MTDDNAVIAASADHQVGEAAVKKPADADPSPADPVPPQASPRLPDVAVPLVLRGQTALVTG